MTIEVHFQFSPISEVEMQKSSKLQEHLDGLFLRKLPKNTVPYFTVLHELEKRYFPHLFIQQILDSEALEKTSPLAHPSNPWEHHYRRMDKIRICQYAQYRNLLKEDDRLLTVEQIRAKARNALISAIQDKKIHTFFLKLSDFSKTKIKTSWWYGMEAQQIDSDSIPWRTDKNKLIANQEIVLLDRRQSVLWIEHFGQTQHGSPDIPSNSLGNADKEIRSACDKSNSVVNKDLYYEALGFILGAKPKYDVARSMFNNLPPKYILPPGRPKKENARKHLDLAILKRIN